MFFTVPWPPSSNYRRSNRLEYNRNSFRTCLPQNASQEYFPAPMVMPRRADSPLFLSSSTEFPFSVRNLKRSPGVAHFQKHFFQDLRQGSQVPAKKQLSPGQRTKEAGFSYGEAPAVPPWVPSPSQRRANPKAFPVYNCTEQETPQTLALRAWK